MESTRENTPTSTHSHTHTSTCRHKCFTHAQHCVCTRKGVQAKAKTLRQFTRALDAHFLCQVPHHLLACVAASRVVTRENISNSCECFMVCPACCLRIPRCPPPCLDTSSIKDGRGRLDKAASKIQRAWLDDAHHHMPEQKSPHNCHPQLQS